MSQSDPSFSPQRSGEAEEHARTPADILRASDKLHKETDDLLRSTDELIRKANWQLLKWKLYLTTSALLTLVSLVLMMFSLGTDIKEWLYGKTHRYQFSGISAADFPRAQFEAEFTKRLTAMGYQVESFHVKYEGAIRKYDGEVTLINVPSKMRDREIRDVLHQVGQSFKSTEQQVEKP